MGVGVGVGVSVGAGGVGVLLEGIGLEGGPVQLATTTVKTKKERIVDTIAICFIGVPPIQVKELTALTLPILYPWIPIFNRLSDV
jgi:hypothetical protein